MKGSPSSGYGSARLSIIRLASISSSRRTRSPLITYLLSDIALTAVQWLSWIALGPGIAYGHIWAATKAILFLLVLWLVYDALRWRSYRARSVVLAGMLSLLFAGWTWSWRPSLTFFDVVNLADGASMAFGGVIMAYTAPFTRPSWPHLVLGWYFLLTALYDFLYVSGFTAANLWLPQALQVVAFGVIFRLLSHPSHPQRYPA